ncbi:MAG: glycosyltransferase [Bdellovibrionaceae bacterium]|nr:glycosyltransferase [Bdellovibrionales bacterium]MCB9084619.1 glycosyltransferase [Pseudobdellovibrionaceae bacterium]
MRILQIGKFYDPVKGGMETALRELSEGLADRGHNIWVAVSGDSWRLEEENPHPRVHLMRLPTYGKIRGIPLTDWRPLEDLLSVGLDVAHVHLPNPLGLKALAKLKVPKVATIHATTVNHPFLSPLYDAHLRRSLEQMDQIIFTSTELRRQVVQTWESLTHPGRVIPLGLKCDWWRALPRVSTDLRGDLLFVGRLVPYKGLGVLLRAVHKSVAKPRLVIVGDGPEKGRLIKLSHELGIDHQVIFAGHIEEQELHRIYMNSRVVVLPSLNGAEAFGLSMVEGLASGRPLICSDLPTGVRGVNLHGETGLRVPPNDVGALSNAIDRVLGEPILYGQMSRNARRHYESHFTRETMVDRHLDLYQEVCGLRTDKISAPLHIQP